MDLSRLAAHLPSRSEWEAFEMGAGRANVDVVEDTNAPQGALCEAAFPDEGELFHTDFKELSEEQRARRAPFFQRCRVWMALKRCGLHPTFQ